MGLRIFLMTCFCAILLDLPKLWADNNAAAQGNHFNFDENAFEKIPWEKVSQKGKVTTYRKDIAGTSLVAFRGEAILDLSMGQVFTAMASQEIRKKWVNNLIHLELVKSYDGISDFEEYLHIDLPWPFRDRDFVNRVVVEYDDKLKRMTADMKSVDKKFVPSHKPEDVIRGTVYHSVWYIQEIDEKSTKVALENLTHPNGYIPSWLVNLIARDWPRKTLAALYEYAKSEEKIDPRFYELTKSSDQEASAKRVQLN